MKLKLPAEYKLPVFPKIIRECLVYMYKPDADTAVLAKTLSQDIGVTASILKLANSSYFLLGKGNPTADLKTGILRIGHENLRQIMLLSALQNTLFFEPIEFLNFKSFCSHASFTSIVCTELSRKIAPEFISDMQIAGLMHDVGLAIMAHLFPDYTTKMVQFCLKHKCDFVHAEDKLMLEHHRELGARILVSWDIPPLVLSLIDNHDIRHPGDRQGLNEQSQLLTDILVFADILAHSYAYGYKNYKRDTKIEMQLLKRMGITADEVKTMLKFCLELANAINS